MYQLFYCCYCISIGAGKQLLIGVQRYPADLFAPNIRQARIVQADRFDSRCKGALIIRHPDFLAIHFNRDYSRNRHIHEDALAATKAAVEEGIVAGGGIACMNAIPAVAEFVDTLEGDAKTGAKIVLKA